MCRFKELTSQQGASLPSSILLNDKDLPRADNDKAKFHIEKLKSFAFKMLLSALCNDFHEIVPEVEINQMDPVHIELVVFMKKVMHILPKVSTQKKKPTAATANLPESERVYDCVVRKAKMFDLFGFFSFNKEFRNRVFSDDIFAIPVALMLEYFTDLRSKFKDQFLKIFDEFRQDCLSENKRYPSYEEILKIESMYFNEQYNKQAPSVKDEFDLPASREERRTWAEARVLEFASHYNLKDELLSQLRDSVRAQDLTGVFFLLVNNLGAPLKVPTLKKCFDLFLMLLRLKHAEPLSEPKMPATKNSGIFNIRYDAGFEPKGKRTAQDELLEVMDNKTAFDDLFAEISNDDLFNFVNSARETHISHIPDSLDLLMTSTSGHEMTASQYQFQNKVVRNDFMTPGIETSTVNSAAPFDDYDMFNHHKLPETRTFETGRHPVESMNATSLYECNLDFDF
mmetsp:Transcript_34585/g.39182  ORF Transcript_34585/g.39182 Transcript_34585/m.39182 type:complete len:455 (+) Transcript_34585:189-1553(+)